MSSRDRILGGLRTTRVPFDSVSARPATYLPVTDDPSDRLARFKTELERLAGNVHIMESPDQAVACVLEIVGTDKAVIAWENLPLPGLEDALRTHQIEIHIPKARGDERAKALEAAERIRVGITGADAAFATTGTLALKTIPGH